MQKLGCVPQQLAGGDIYPALEKGTIDAAEWVGPMTTKKARPAQVAPHFTIPDGGKAARCCSSLINLDKWNALAEILSSLLEQAGHLATTG